MILTMKKGSATNHQSKRRTENNTLMLFSSRYHGRQKMSIEKCQVCGNEGANMTCSICEGCLRADRRPRIGRKALRILVVPIEEEVNV